MIIIIIISYLIVYSPVITLVAFFANPPLAITLALIHYFTMVHFVELTDDDYNYLKKIIKEDD
jgi:hypothetical protein